MTDPIRFVRSVWHDQGKGFGFLSFKDSEGAWRDLAYRYPDDEIRMPNPALGDVYFTPNLFSKPRRRKELVLPSCWLYADLDEVDPKSCEVKPTIAWESSPKRYQALWHVDEHLSAERHQSMNKKLTYFIDADKGGWDLTQVLRVPGTINHKYPACPRVKILWT